MLVLSRKHGQCVVIQVPGLAEPILVEVKLIRGSVVRLGFEAEKAVKVMRGELVAVEADQQEEADQREGVAA